MVVKIAYPHGQNMGDTLISLYYLCTVNVKTSVGSTWVVSIDHTASLILGFSLFSYYVPPVYPDHWAAVMVLQCS